jgi:hypothetical protein
MDLCYLDDTKMCQSLLNLSNMNYAEFTAHVSIALGDNVSHWQDVVDTQNLDNTGDTDYDAWKLEQAAEEAVALNNAQNVRREWADGTATIAVVIEAVGIAMLHPNSRRYELYYSHIVREGAKALAVGNPPTYWA